MNWNIWKKIVIVAFAVLLGAVLIKYIFPIFIPFLLAWGVAFCLQPALRVMARRSKCGKRVLSGILVAVTVLGVGTLVFLLASRLLSELGNFVYDLSADNNGGVNSFFDKLESFISRVPFVSAYVDDVSLVIEDAIRDAVMEVTSEIPAFIVSVVGALPSFILFTVILITASYYFASDYDDISEKLYGLLPDGVKRVWNKLKGRLATVGVQYLKACLVLTFITFVELAVGLFTLGMPYAFTLAFVIALVDMLPILGAGTVLVPWAVWEWLVGDIYYSIGLLIIFTVVSLVRRFAEPRIISSGIGLSPITTLFSMYLGFYFFGIGGLFFAPLFAVIILNALPDTMSAKLGLRVEYGEASTGLGGAQNVGSESDGKRRRTV